MKISKTNELLLQVYGGLAIIWGVAAFIGGPEVLFFAFIFFVVFSIPVIFGLEEMGYFDKKSDE